jgi:hypothetical protein
VITEFASRMKYAKTATGVLITFVDSEPEIHG